MLSFNNTRSNSGEKNWLFLALAPVFLLNICSNFQYLNLIFFIPTFLYFFLAKIEFKYLLISVLFCSLIFILISLFPKKIQNTYFAFLNNFFDVHKFITSFLEKKYDPELAKFMNLLLFNKSKYDSSIYKELRTLGITHLITVSGFHFSVLKKFFDFLFKDKKFLKNCFSIPCFLLFWSANNYSISTTRAVLNLLIPEKNKFKKWSFASIISFFLNFYIYTSFSFLLSYIIPLIFLLVEKFFPDWLNRFVFKNFFTFLYIHTLFLPSFKKIIFLLPLNLIIFTPILGILFLFFLFSFFILSLRNIHFFIYDNFVKLINFSKINKEFFELNFWTQDLSKICIFFLCFCFLFLYFYREIEYKIFFNKKFLIVR